MVREVLIFPILEELTHPRRSRLPLVSMHSLEGGIESILTVAQVSLLQSLALPLGIGLEQKGEKYNPNNALSR